MRRCDRCAAAVNRAGDVELPALAASPEAADLDGDPQRATLMGLFADRQTEGMVAFVEGCPDTPLNGAVLQAVRSGYPETQYMAFCLLADPYARGVNASLGLSIAAAVYTTSQTAFTETQRPDFLDTAAQAAVTSLIGLNSVGRHDDATRFGEAALAWLGDRGHTDQKPSLLMSCIDAHLGLSQFEQASDLLDAAEAIEIPPSQPAARTRLQTLRATFDAVASESFAGLPRAPEGEGDALEAGRRELADQVRVLKELLTGVDLPESDDVATELTALLDQSSATTRTAFAVESRPIAGKLTDILSGAGAGMTTLRNRNRMINAALIFADPVRGHDPSAINDSLEVLQEAYEWAKANHSVRDEVDALWSMYLAYSRTERPERAIEALQALRWSLEARRSQIADPEERAGAMQDFPYLFAALSRLLCQAGRAAELLDAMEGAKGRYLSDVLTAARGDIVPDAEFVAPMDDLTRVLGPHNAHYLSFFVDDDATYAALLAKDGSFHCHVIPIDQGTLRSLAASADPAKWDGWQAGFLTPKVAPVPTGMSPLVQWLEPLIQTGVVEPGDHLCYAPDDVLHLVPLHYLPLAGAPIIQSFSVSRIHSAAALLALLRRPSERPAQFAAVQVPAQSDLGDPKKLSDLAAGRDWLSEHLAGTTLAHSDATLEALAAVDLTDRVVHFATHGTFPLHDAANRNPNPFYASGLALAVDGELPSVGAFASGQADHVLLTPERAVTMDFGRSHVTLQACVSGLAKEGLGGDALGLDLALLLAGAQSLLTTHWNVTAGASADFSVRFYRKWLLENATRAEAWRAASLELMAQQHRGGKPEEYYWAGFSLSGDFR